MPVYHTPAAIERRRRLARTLLAMTAVLVSCALFAATMLVVAGPAALA